MLGLPVGRQDTIDGVIFETLLKKARWWFQTFFIFTPTWGEFPF